MMLVPLLPINVPEKIEPTMVVPAPLLRIKRGGSIAAAYFRPHGCLTTISPPTQKPQRNNSGQALTPITATPIICMAHVI